MVQSMEAGLGLGAGRRGLLKKAKKGTFIICGIVSETLSAQIIGYKFSSEIRE
jgi:hypothetical protein